tara:strand:+ start:398 stop:631 length:234 start_codon:yes stop_codon:yes gene_type:complete
MQPRRCRGIIDGRLLDVAAGRSRFPTARQLETSEWLSIYSPLFSLAREKYLATIGAMIEQIPTARAAARLFNAQLMA